MNSFYTQEELRNIGFKSLGENVLLSRHTSIYSVGKISIGSNVRIDDFCILSGSITIGNNVHIAPYCGLFAGDYGIDINDFSGISSRCIIYSLTDDYSGQYLTNLTIPDKYRNVIGGKVTLGKHALIGTGTTILPNVNIEDGVSVGSMSLVNKDLPAWGIYVGIPCRKLKDRDNNILSLEKNYLSELEPGSDS